MLYNANSPNEYLNQLEDDWRKEKLLTVRKMILSQAPDMIERIDYKMLCYSLGDQSVFHLNAQRAYVSLYVGDLAKIEDSKAMLSEFNMGKGCIRIKKSIDLSATQLHLFSQQVCQIWRAGGETDC